MLLLRMTPIMITSNSRQNHVIRLTPRIIKLRPFIRGILNINNGNMKGTTGITNRPHRQNNQYAGINVRINSTRVRNLNNRRGNLIRVISVFTLNGFRLKPGIKRRLHHALGRLPGFTTKRNTIKGRVPRQNLRPAGSILGINVREQTRNGSNSVRSNNFINRSLQCRGNFEGTKVTFRGMNSNRKKKTGRKVD